MSPSELADQTAIEESTTGAGRQTAARRVGWVAITGMSTLVGAYAVMLVVTGFQFVPASIAANHFPSALGLRAHIMGAAVALLVGPWQFLRPLRRRWPRAHRVLGRIYVVGCVVGGVAGAAIALFSTAGLVAGTGFLALGVAWLGSTVAAVRAAISGHFVVHQRWMLRSFALTFAAVTLRIYLPVAAVAGIGFDVSYPAIAWLCWVPNLIVVQALVRRARGTEDF